MAHFLELLAFPLLNCDYFRTETDISLLKQIPSKDDSCLREREGGGTVSSVLPSLAWDFERSVDKVIVTVLISIMTCAAIRAADFLYVGGFP